MLTKLSFLGLALVLLNCTACSFQKEDTSKANLFAPGNVNTNMSERDAALSADESIFFFSVQLTRQHSAICYSTKLNGKWIRPRVASFSGKYMDIEPVFHPDGRLFFSSNRPLQNETEAGDYNIWYVSKNETGWSEPTPLDSLVNSAENEFYPSFTTEGDLYFTATLEGGKGSEDLWMSKFDEGQFQQPENLGDSINTANYEYNSFVSPDASFILFSSHGWGEGYGRADIYVSFRDENGNWHSPKNIGEKVNTSAFEYCPSLSPDGKILYFTRINSPSPEGERWSYFEMVSSFNSLENGQGNIYYISSDFLNELK